MDDPLVITKADHAKICAYRDMVVAKRDQRAADLVSFVMDPKTRGRLSTALFKTCRFSMSLPEAQTEAAKLIALVPADDEDQENKDAAAAAMKGLILKLFELNDRARIDADADATVSSHREFRRQRLLQQRGHVDIPDPVEED